MSPPNDPENVETPAANDDSPAEAASETPTVSGKSASNVTSTSAGSSEAVKPAFLLIGVGASAGGLEALKQLLSAVPKAPGMAFVIVTHQQSGNVSMLPELLGKHTSLSVVLAQSGIKIAPNIAYVAPPGDVVVEDGMLLIHDHVAEVPHHPIDTFFRSLAASWGERGVAVVLSGTGTDGTSGIAEVKAAGGLVLAQDPDSARYPGMPASAVASRFVDAALAPAEMPKTFARFAAGLAAAPSEPEVSKEEDASAALFRVLHLLRTRTGQDFTSYKKSTLWRRLERRLTVRGVSSAAAYAKLLEDTPEELETLFRELLISVTSFFRDPDTFATLAVQLEKLFQDWEDERPFRAWVPACATGEEAYSLAITIREAASQSDKRIPVQIFATDLDQPAIDFARIGHYPIGIASNVTPERLQRFFIKTDYGYKIAKEIREIIVFAPQNVIKDPPFTKLDLLSCRNLLIYLEPELQRRVIGLFSYALRPDGLLLLGSSESIAQFDEAFHTLDKKHKLFRRRDTRPETPSDFPEVPTSATHGRPHRTSGVGRGELAATAERVVLAHLSPPSVLVNERGDILYFHGKTGKFLEPAAGEPISNLFGMAREGLRIDLASALRQATSRLEPVVRPGLKVRSNGGHIRVRLTVRRLDEPELVRGMFLVSFEVEPEPAERELGSRGRESEHSQVRVNDLELELQHTRDNLQATIEELETSNEELKSTNEELQSTNEELQSANEELETSREEMQSLNEELQTVNSELEERNRALSQANDDMQNLLNSTDVATVFLDDKLAIKRFTTQARKVFSLIDTDIGRPISDLTANLRYEELVSDAREVLTSLIFQEREILTKEGAWRLMRIMPYRTAENVIDGLVMTFIDIDRTKRQQEEADSARRFAEALLAAFPSGVAVLDGELRVVATNPAFLTLFKTNAKRTIGEPIQFLAEGVLDRPELIQGLEAVRDRGAELKKTRITSTAHRLGNRPVFVSANRVNVERSSQVLVMLLVEDAARGMGDEVLA